MHENSPGGAGRGRGEVSSILTIVISVVVSFLVAYVTAKRCFDKIDGYVQEVIGRLNAALDEVTNRFGRNQGNK